MVTAVIYFDTSNPDGFVGALDTTGELFEDVQGFHGFNLMRGVEDPNRFLLLVEWDSAPHLQDRPRLARAPPWRALRLPGRRPPASSRTASNASSAVDQEQKAVARRKPHSRIAIIEPDNGTDRVMRGA